MVIEGEDSKRGMHCIEAGRRGGRRRGGNENHSYVSIIRVVNTWQEERGGSSSERG